VAPIAGVGGPPLDNLPLGCGGGSSGWLRDCVVVWPGWGAPGCALSRGAWGYGVGDRVACAPNQCCGLSPSGAAYRGGAGLGSAPRGGAQAGCGVSLHNRLVPYLVLWLSRYSTALNLQHSQLSFPFVCVLPPIRRSSKRVFLPPVTYSLDNYVSQRLHPACEQVHDGPVIG
jgi:hypothetical protein